MAHSNLQFCNKLNWHAMKQLSVQLSHTKKKMILENYIFLFTYH